MRSYVGLPLIKNILQFKLPRADRALFFSALLTLAWIFSFVFVILGLGLPTAVDLIHVGVKGIGPRHRAHLRRSRAAVRRLSPLPLLVLVSQAIEMGFEVLWPPEMPGGKRSRGVEDLSVFRSIPLFSKLSDEDLATIAAHSREVTYAPGHIIVEQGTTGETFYSVRQGVVTVERGEQDRAKIVARLGVGDCFGETAMLKDGVRTATVKAMTQVVLIELASEAFEKVVATVGGVDFASVLRAANTIGKSRLFRELPAERLSSLATRFVPRTVPANTDVVRFGEHGDEFYLVGKGQLEVLDANGKKLVSLGDGDHFGEVALLRDVPRTATVRTVSDSLLLVLSREVFLQALHADLSLRLNVSRRWPPPDSKCRRNRLCWRPRHRSTDVAGVAAANLTGAKVEGYEVIQRLAVAAAWASSMKVAPATARASPSRR